MLDFGAVNIEWGLWLLQLIFIGLPVWVTVFISVQSGLKRKIRELEQRINLLEKDKY